MVRLPHKREDSVCGEAKDSWTP